MLFIRNRLHRLQFLQYDTNFNRFWLRSVDEEKLFDEIQSQLNSLSRDFEPITDISQIHTGQVVAAPYNGLYYRARILLIVRGTSKIFVNVTSPTIFQPALNIGIDFLVIF